MGAGRLSVWSWSLALFLAVWWLSFHPMRNADLWWHLAAGRWIGEHRATRLGRPARGCLGAAPAF
jgi:hypothetical protein